MATLTWLDATAGASRLEPLWTFLREQVERLVDGRFDVRLSHVAFNSGGIRHPASRLLNDAALLAAAVRDASTSDVIVLGCWGSPVTRVRAAVRVPVASLPEASAVAALALARNAVVITVAPSLVPVFTTDIAEYGGTGLHDCPVCTYLPESTHDEVVEAIRQPATIIDRFDAAARKAVAGGADAIIVGCGYVGPILAAHGYHHVGGMPQVPVWDSNRLAAEHAVYLHRLHETGIRPAPTSYAPPTGRAGEAFRTALTELGGALRA